MRDSETHDAERRIRLAVQPSDQVAKKSFLRVGKREVKKALPKIGQASRQRTGRFPSQVGIRLEARLHFLDRQELEFARARATGVDRVPVDPFEKRHFRENFALLYLTDQLLLAR